MSLFNLQANVKLNTTDYEKGVRKATKQGEMLGNSFTGIGTKSVVMGSLIASGIRNIGTKILEAGKIGFNYNSQMQSYTANFKVMLGSTEEAIKKVEELKKFASATPFGMQDLADATQQLLAFQVPAEDTNHILHMLGDVSLGNAEKLQGLALVFGQVSSAGKLTGQDLMQFINQGFNPLNYIAQRTGETMAEVRERMSEGGVSIQEVTQAFEDATSKGGQFYQGLEEGSTTTQGLLSTLSDTIQGKLGELFEVISVKTTETLPKIIEFVDNLNVQKIVNVMGKLINTFKTITPIIVGATTATIAYRTAVAIAGIINRVRKATSLATAVQAVFNATMMANPFVLVTTIIFGLIGALVALIATNKNVKDKLIAQWEALKASAKAQWERFKTLFTETIPETFHELVESAKKWGRDLLDNFIGGIREKVSNLTESLRGVAQKVKDFLGFSEPKKGPLSNFHTYAPDMIDLFIKGIKDNENKLTDQIADSFDFERKGVPIGTYENDGTQTTGKGVTIVQNIYSKAQTASDLMQEALNRQEQEVFMNV